MSGDHVKLTVRLPTRLHKALKERAVEYKVSLNQTVVDALAAGLDVQPPADSEAEQVRQMLEKYGLLADTSWVDEFLPGVEPATLEEAQEWLSDVPLTEWIIEDRGSQ